MLAARSGNLVLVKALLRRGSEVNARAKNGWTALMYAVQGGFPDVVGQLIQAGAVTDTVDTYGQTPLMIAAYSPGVLRILLNTGGQMNSRDMNGETALMRAVADDESLGPGNFEAVSMLLMHGADVNLQDKEGLTALMRACAYDDPGIVRLLLEHGASLQAKDKQGRTPFSIAVAAGNESVLTELKRFSH
jgi:ankyrin repeat protein